MKGDFSRDTFDPHKRYSRVLMQQGRVTLDADWNEQAALQQRQARLLARTVIGPHGGRDRAFAVADATGAGPPGGRGDFGIARGVYFVDGLACEADADTTYAAQAPGAVAQPLRDGAWLAFVDAWERVITSLDDPSLLEPALGGVDTTLRTQVAWQVRVLPLGDADASSWRDDHEAFLAFLRTGRHVPIGDGELAADAVGGYTGVDNRLYRVEVHAGGGTWSGDARDTDGLAQAATFKWSRADGAVLYAVERLDAEGDLAVRATLRARAGEDRVALATGDVVELADDDRVRERAPGMLARVLDVDGEGRGVVLDLAPSCLSLAMDAHPLLRRWDQPAQASVAMRDSAIVVQAATDGAGPALDLEDGIAVRFRAGRTYVTGDYWLMPARTATGDIEWPRAADDGTACTASGGVGGWRAPRGETHGFAPLAVVAFDRDGALTTVQDLRRVLLPAWAR